MVRPKLTGKLRTWAASIGLCVALLGLGAATFAQFQVNQRQGWISTSWRMTDTQRPLEAQIQAGLVAETKRNSNILGQILHIKAPMLGLDETFVAGDNLSPQDDVRVASNIKPFVAAAALKLVEDGRLSLDKPIAPFLSEPVRQILEKADRPIDVTTLRHLLNHSSGFANYGSSRLFQIIAYVPTAFGFARHWTAEEQIWFAANLTPKGQVGSQFDYADTNYLLASDMIAKATNTPNAGIALRSLLDWPALGAPSAFWEFYEPTPAATRLVRQFRGAIEDTDLDVSFDQYGGGGLVMSMSDLAHAHRAITRGEIFTNRTETLKSMQAAGTAAGTNGYALGIAPIVIAGETCWTHSGRWGTTAVHCPRIDLTIARSWGQSNAGPDLQDPNGIAAGLIKLMRNKALVQTE